MPLLSWNDLNISRIDSLRRDVDAAINALQDAINDESTAIPFLIDEIRKQLQLITKFMNAHDDDDRISLFDSQRLRLRKAIQPSFFDNHSSPPKERIHNVPPPVQSSLQNINSNQNLFQSTFANPSPTINKSQFLSLNDLNSSVLSASPVIGDAVTPTVKFSRENGVTTNKYFTGSGLKTAAKKTTYAWENEDSPKKTKKKMLLDEFSFIPTSVPGYYVREDGDFTSDDQFVEFQIMLTPEEVSTLAARKKSWKKNLEANRQGWNKSKSISLQASTPYVDPKRIAKEHLRPSQPEKWVSS